MFAPPPELEKLASTQGALPAERAIPHLLPPVLGTGDLIALFLFNVFWVTNITPMAIGGVSSFLYWGICGLTFFIPCSFVMAQLARMYPASGGIVTWTFHALGAKWSFFVGICAWLPGILSIVNAAVAVISLVQAVQPNWLEQTWQQGVALLALLLFCSVLACQRTRMVQHVLNIGACAMGLATILVLAATVQWLMTGHHPVSALSVGEMAITPSNLALLGSATLALFGSNMPLALLGEIPSHQQQRANTRHLFWGTSLTLAGYLVFTLAVLVIQGAGAAMNTVNPLVLLLSTVQRVFGLPLRNVMALCLGFYFLMIPVALHVCFARLLVVFSLDRRISRWFGKVTRHRVPRHAISAQGTITLAVALVIYFLVPALFSGNAADLSSMAYNVLGASLLLVWAISFVFPFLDLGVLAFRARPLLVRYRLLPLPLLLPLIVLCAVTGSALCLASIVFTMMNSFIPSLLPNGTWWYVIGGIALSCLLAFATLSALSHSEATWEELRGEVPDAPATLDFPGKEIVR
jgi:amino acid transporter